MLTGPFLSKNWIGASESYDESTSVLVGIPYDGTCSYRPGTRFGPEMCRVASYGIETYSPYQDRDIEDINFFDAGELDLPFGNRNKVLDIIEQAAYESLNDGKKWVGVGGEHLVTYPVIKSYVKKYPDLVIIHFDAHTDLREDYMGEKLSHATVIKRCIDLIGADSLAQIGIRSGTKKEFDFMHENNTLWKKISDAQTIIKKFSNRPVFLTIDVDVLDPGVFPGTGTPEAGGLNFNQLIEWLTAFKSLNFVGADVVELSPHYDSSGGSNVLAAKIVREILLLVNS